MSGIYVFLGGGAGALLRYSVSILVSTLSLPLWVGTLFVNTLGSIILVLFYDLIISLDLEKQLLLRVGFLGALTTFSTMSFEIIDMIKKGSVLAGGGILILNILFGIVVGVFLSR